ncbi:hypothetical protein [Sporosarcina jiandibaonis]|uniref:hypothetical protein n=1 Tax=Sporosarcina jiandibaonis TaxID=2715535 RepID=UPI001553E377|nr:hypothetical protein [Sporosarcina jiandibaonis]
MSDLTCNNERCNKKFNIKLRKKKHGVSVIEHFFFCPHCKTRYSSHVTDQEIRKRQRDMRKYREELNQVAKDWTAGKCFGEVYDEKITFIGQKERELKALVDNLKAKIASK